MKLSDEALTDLYKWVDSIPLSKPKKNIARDFSDGVLVAEIVKHFFPKLVNIHNYHPCSNVNQKMENWDYLNRKVFSKLRFELDDKVMRDISNSVPGVVESFLDKLRSKIDHALWHMKTHPPRRESDKPEADQLYDSPQRKGTFRHRSPARGSEPIVPPQNTLGPPRPTVPYYSGQESEAVSALMYDDKVQESLSKDETIQILQTKIRKLEHLLHLKDMKISELQDHLDDLRPTVKTKRQQKFR